MELFKRMTKADQEGNEEKADKIRDEMDVVWFKLNAEECDKINKELMS